MKKIFLSAICIIALTFIVNLSYSEVYPTITKQPDPEKFYILVAVGNYGLFFFEQGTEWDFFNHNITVFKFKVNDWILKIANIIKNKEGDYPFTLNTDRQWTLTAYYTFKGGNDTDVYGKYTIQDAFKKYPIWEGLKSAVYEEEIK